MGRPPLTGDALYRRKIYQRKLFKKKMIAKSKARLKLIMAGAKFKRKRKRQSSWAVTNSIHFKNRTPYRRVPTKEV